MITSIIKALGFSIGCSCPMNCQASEKPVTPPNDTIIATVIVDTTDAITNEPTSALAAIQDISKIYTI